MELFTASLRTVITKRIDELIEHETERACDELKKRINKEADKLALEILNLYDIQSTADKIVITVRKGDSCQK